MQKEHADAAQESKVDFQEEKIILII